MPFGSITALKFVIKWEGASSGRRAPQNYRGATGGRSVYGALSLRSAQAPKALQRLLEASAVDDHSVHILFWDAPLLLTER